MPASSTRFEMPTFLAGVLTGPRSTPWGLLEHLPAGFLPLLPYPALFHAGKPPLDPYAVSVRTVIDAAHYEAVLRESRPPFTLLCDSWYNVAADVGPLLDLALVHSGRVVVGCQGPRIIDELPASVIIGIRGAHRGSPYYHRPPPGALAGRDVAVIGNSPYMLWLTSANCLLLGARVLLVVLTTEWWHGAKSRHEYWDPALRRVVASGALLPDIERTALRSLLNIRDAWSRGLKAACNAQIQ